MTFTIGVFAIIFDSQDRVLLSHRRDLDMWNLPGGAMEPGELPTETAIRETSEETGLEVEITRLIGVYTKPGKDELVFAFLCHITGGELTATDESDANRYFPLGEIPVNTLPKHVERIHDAIAGSDQPVFREQTLPSGREYLEKLKNVGV